MVGLQMKSSFFRPIEEDRYVIAQANAEVTDTGNFLRDAISARKGREFVLVPPHEINYMDVSRNSLSVSQRLLFLSSRTMTRTGP
jgi:DNA-directed RNA polymerase subunit beta